MNGHMSFPGQEVPKIYCHCQEGCSPICHTTDDWQWGHSLQCKQQSFWAPGPGGPRAVRWVTDILMMRLIRSTPHLASNQAIAGALSIRPAVCLLQLPIGGWWAILRARHSLPTWPLAATNSKADSKGSTLRWPWRHEEHRREREWTFHAIKIKCGFRHNNCQWNYWGWSNNLLKSAERPPFSSVFPVSPLRPGFGLFWQALYNTNTLWKTVITYQVPPPTLTWWPSLFHESLFCHWQRSWIPAQRSALAHLQLLQ